MQCIAAFLGAVSYWLSYKGLTTHWWKRKCLDISITNQCKQEGGKNMFTSRTQPEHIAFYISLFSSLLSSSSRHYLSQPWTLRVTFMLTFSPGLIPRAYFYKDSWHQFKSDNLRSSNILNQIIQFLSSISTIQNFWGKAFIVGQKKKIKVKKI